MRKIIIPFLFVCSMSFGQMFSAQNAESCAGCDTTATEVTIGTQIWMRKNLDVIKYNDNTAIPLVTDGIAWSELTTPAYCWYNNDSTTYHEYGALYNGFAVTTGKLCPSGYHVPDTTEWRTLINYVGGNNVAGGRLKEAGTAHWQTPNIGANDTVCFTALPGGSRPLSFNYIGMYNYLWNSTVYDAQNLYLSSMYYNFSQGVYISYNTKTLGFSVRCIKD